MATKNSTKPKRSNYKTQKAYEKALKEWKANQKKKNSKTTKKNRYTAKTETYNKGEQGTSTKYQGPTNKTGHIAAYDSSVPFLDSDGKPSEITATHSALPYSNLTQKTNLYASTATMLKAKWGSNAWSLSNSKNVAGPTNVGSRRPIEITNNKGFVSQNKTTKNNDYNNGKNIDLYDGTPYTASVKTLMKNTANIYKRLNYGPTPSDPSNYSHNIQSSFFDKGNLISGLDMNSIMDTVHDALMMDMPSTTQSEFKKYMHYYNRFKIPDPNLALAHGHAHVFFVKPSCNIHNLIYDDTGSKAIQSELFGYVKEQTPGLLYELDCNHKYSDSSDNGVRSDFMMSLSNFVTTFSPSDEYIETDSYGKTYTGYKIAYGKNAIASKTAGEITFTFNDDRYLHIYQLLRLWVEYIDGVYRGTLSIDKSTIWNKVLDYAGSLYYIVTSEDGESIIFWSKYYGVFPKSIPSTQLAWAEGNVIQNPQINCDFSYSFKEDYNPSSLIEFNKNAFSTYNTDELLESGNKSKLGDSILTLPTYDRELGHGSRKWSNRPFIELCKSDDGPIDYIYKLRFEKI